MMSLQVKSVDLQTMAFSHQGCHTLTTSAPYNFNCDHFMNDFMFRCVNTVEVTLNRGRVPDGCSGPQKMMQCVVSIDYVTIKYHPWILDIITYCIKTRIAELRNGRYCQRGVVNDVPVIVSVVYTYALLPEMKNVCNHKKNILKIPTLPIDEMTKRFWAAQTDEQIRQILIPENTAFRRCWIHETKNCGLPFGYYKVNFTDGINYDAAAEGAFDACVQMQIGELSHANGFVNGDIKLNRVTVNKRYHLWNSLVTQAVRHARQTYPNMFADDAEQERCIDILKTHFDTKQLLYKHKFLDMPRVPILTEAEKTLKGRLNAKIRQLWRESNSTKTCKNFGIELYMNAGLHRHLNATEEFVKDFYCMVNSVGLCWIED